MSVYFIASGDLVKIGFSRDPIKRAKQLAYRFRRNMRILAIIDGGMPVERGLHRVFEALRVKNEWFKNSGPLAKYLSGLPKDGRLVEYTGGMGPDDRDVTHVRVSMAAKKALEIIAKRETRSITAQITVFLRQAITADAANQRAAIGDGGK